MPREVCTTGQTGEDAIIQLSHLHNSDFSSEQVNLTCDILCICMSNLEIDQTTTISYYNYLERCLQHNNVDVKVLALNDIERRLDQPSAVAFTAFDTNILTALVKCLEVDDTNVSTVAVRILIKLLPKSLNDKEIRNLLEATLSAKDLLRCRVYEIAVKLSRTSVEVHADVEFILEKIINDLDSEDMLLLLNILDFLAEIALSEHGLVYLENKSVFAKVLRQVEQLDSSPLKTILVPGYMKFFGHIATAQPTKIIQGFSSMINSLFDCILDGNSSVLPVAFDTLGKETKKCRIPRRSHN